MLNIKNKQISGTVQLTGSKSESNRALLIQSLANGLVGIENLSAADDTLQMTKALEDMQNRQNQSQNDSLPVVIDIGPAGTAMRFMTALLAITEGNFTITGSRRMQERPISLLVDALKELGAQITYQKNEGYPPLQIKGGFEQKSKVVKMPGNVSSQYLSALLLIAPALPKGLELEITGMLTSKPYLTMTLEMMKEAGIHYTWNENIITIEPQAYQKANLQIEPDWSAASYWYSLLCLAKEGTLLLPGLKAQSLQGDRAIAEIMQQLGVKTTFLEAGGIKLEKQEIQVNNEVIDFTHCPDLAQTVIACAAALKQDLKLTGLHTLRIKETDRIAALQNEIGKFGVKLIEQNEIFHLDTAGYYRPEKLTFNTYEDHRMAMSFAPLALVFDQVQINDPEVVEKSYPEFWAHLAAMGISLD